MIKIAYGMEGLIEDWPDGLIEDIGYRRAGSRSR